MNNLVQTILGILMIAVIILAFSMAFWMPCKYLGWVAVKDLPARCL